MAKSEKLIQNRSKTIRVFQRASAMEATQEYIRKHGPVDYERELKMKSLKRIAAEQKEEDNDDDDDDDVEKTVEFKKSEY